MKNFKAGEASSKVSVMGRGKSCQPIKDWLSS